MSALHSGPPQTDFCLVIQLFTLNISLSLHSPNRRCAVHEKMNLLDWKIYFLPQEMEMQKPKNSQAKRVQGKGKGKSKGIAASVPPKEEFISEYTEFNFSKNQNGI